MMGVCVYFLKNETEKLVGLAVFSFFSFCFLRMPALNNRLSFNFVVIFFSLNSHKPLASDKKYIRDNMI